MTKLRNEVLMKSASFRISPKFATKAHTMLGRTRPNEASLSEISDTHPSKSTMQSALAIKWTHGEGARVVRGVWGARTDSYRAGKAPYGAKRYVSLGTKDVSPSGADRPNRRRLSDRGTGGSAGVPRVRNSVVLTASSSLCHERRSRFPRILIH